MRNGSSANESLRITRRIFLATSRPPVERIDCHSEAVGGKLDRHCVHGEVSPLQIGFDVVDQSYLGQRSPKVRTGRCARKRCRRSRIPILTLTVWSCDADSNEQLAFFSVNASANFTASPMMATSGEVADFREPCNDVTNHAAHQISFGAMV